MSKPNFLCFLIIFSKIFLKNSRIFFLFLNLFILAPAASQPSAFSQVPILQQAQSQAISSESIFSQQQSALQQPVFQQPQQSAPQQLQIVPQQQAVQAPQQQPLAQVPEAPTTEQRQSDPFPLRECYTDDSSRFLIKIST